MRNLLECAKALLIRFQTPDAIAANVTRNFSIKINYEFPES